MRTEAFSVSGSGGTVLPCTLWLPEGTVRGVLQITHGMTEHMGRYVKLARLLTDSGIAVAGFDLRGHGVNGTDPVCASFGEHGWDETLEDMHLFREALQLRFAELPYFMLGFSLGSFLMREYLSRYGTEGLAGAVIMGTGHQPGLVLTVIMAIVKSQWKTCGFDGTTDMVKQLSFGTYNKKFEPVRTEADWLCGDAAELDAYLADPLCRESISAGLFWQLLDAMRRTGRKDAYARWNKALPVLLLSGADDPVGDQGKGVARVEQAMKKAGLTNVETRLFPEARHDLLHEEQSGCAADARKLICDWILSNI